LRCWANPSPGGQAHRGRRAKDRSGRM